MAQVYQSRPQRLGQARDRPRMKARNIDDPPPALRHDPGLCNRFGQTDGRGPLHGRRLRRSPVLGPTRTAPGRRDVHFALERALLTAHLEGEMHLSRAECTSRRAQDQPAPANPGRPPPAPPRADPGPRTTTSGEKGSVKLGDDVKGSTASPSRWGSTPRVEGRACRRRGSSSVGCALRGWRGAEVLTVRHLTEHPTKRIHPAILHHP